MVTLRDSNKAKDAQKVILMICISGMIHDRNINKAKHVESNLLEDFNNINGCYEVRCCTWGPWRTQTIVKLQSMGECKTILSTNVP